MRPEFKDKRIAILGWINSVHVQRWARGLAERGFKTKVISLGGQPRDGVDATIIPRFGKVSYLARAGQAARALEAFRPHLVHAHSAAGYGWWLQRSEGRPRVVSVWGADVIDFPSNWFKRKIIRRVLLGADHVTATSGMLKEVVAKLAPEVSKKTSVIPFGVTVPESIVPPPPQTLPRLCFIKAHNRKYGPDILLRAMVHVVRAIPSIQLSIAGWGELGPVLRRMTSELNLDETVKFVGFIENTKIYDFVRKHHVMVMPSVMQSESFGVAVLEAGACGRAVIASRVGGVPEVLVDGRTGILVEPGDVSQLAETIIKLVKDPELCAEMGRNGYQFVKQNYDWEDSIDSMVELYERLLHSTPGH